MQRNRMIDSKVATTGVSAGPRLAASFAPPTSRVCPCRRTQGWPRWASQVAQRTSVRTMPYSWSSTSLTLLRSTAAQKDGQPVPESNLVSDLTRHVPQTTHLYMPTPLWFQYLPVKGVSVAEHCD